MRISGVPQLQVIHMERLYGHKLHITCDRWFTIALLALGFGQVWAKLGLRKSRTTLGEIVRLHNCAVADITPQLWHDVTPQQRDGWCID